MATPMCSRAFRTSLQVLPRLFHVTDFKLITTSRSLLRTSAADIPHCRVQSFHTTPYCHQETNSEEGNEEGGASEETVDSAEVKRLVVDVETSIEYMKSKAYNIAYGGAHVWVPYRRNHKGAYPRSKTRKTCIRKGVVTTGNPCPICRDEYLVVHPKNTELLKQFISPSTGRLLSYTVTGVCQKQHKDLMIAITKAWDDGSIEMPLPHRIYDYSQYYSKDLLKQNKMLS